MSKILTIETPISKIDFSAMSNLMTNQKCSLLSFKTGCYQISTGIFSGISIFLSPVGIVLTNNIGFDLTNKEELKRLNNEISTVFPKPKYIFYSGKLLTGHPEVNESVDDTLVFYHNEKLLITKFNKMNFETIAEIPINEIIDVTLEDASTIEKRITATRLLAIGIFAFAAKKKELNKLLYVTIKWKGAKIDFEVIFEFHGDNSNIHANNFKNKLSLICNEI